MEYKFNEIVRQATPGDNVVIALCDLKPGDVIKHQNGKSITIKYFVLEGHRIAFSEIKTGEKLLSWGLPFGLAIHDILPGEALFNDSVLRDLKKRKLNIFTPNNPNFKDWSQKFILDHSNIAYSEQVRITYCDRTFQGFERPNGRGSGIRNHVVVLGTSSRVTPFIKLLSKSLPNEFTCHTKSFDGVVTVYHSEGGGFKKENNHELVLRTLSGWIVHSNISSILLIDHGDEAVNNKEVFDYLKIKQYPIKGSLIKTLSISKRQISSCLNEARNSIGLMVDNARKEQRTSCPLSDIKIALQCGGSDAFSGMSGNPLAGIIAKEAIQHGGSANLAETSELIGAESYVLQKVKNLDVAKRFLNTIDRFQSMAQWHGHSAEGNPSGGNLFRGLYNISVKSIGAANKKHPDLRLDDVIDYGQRMTESGFYFMDSAGNDLESIAGQVASGCNLVLFITGNGSITNFPFVPTLKIVTTTKRYKQLELDMDINAGEYLDGTTLSALKGKYFNLALETCEGRRTVGEKAGHSQAQIWRNWHMGSERQLTSALQSPSPSGVPLKLTWTSELISQKPQKIKITESLSKTFQKSIIIPTSLCSSEVASRIAKELNDESQKENIVALSHTEGCGVSRGPSEELFIRTMVGYALHPSVKSVLFLEHGCEKTHHAEFQNFLLSMNECPDNYAWESIQAGGGLEKAKASIRSWKASIKNSDIHNINHPALGVFTTSGKQSEGWMIRLLQLVQLVTNDLKGSVIISEKDPFIDFIKTNKILSNNSQTSLSYGESLKMRFGFHIMESQSTDPVEILTGLGACGATHFFMDPDSLENNFQYPPLSIPVKWDRATQDFIEQFNESHFQRSFQITRGHQGFSL